MESGSADPTERGHVCVNQTHLHTWGGMKEKLTFCLSGMSSPAYEAEH